MDASTLLRKKIGLLFLVCIATTATAQEFIVNGDFNSLTSGWTTQCTSVEAYYTETTYGGTVATNQVAEIDDESCFYQDVCAWSGMTYAFSMKASRRTGNGASANPLTSHIRITGLDAANAVVATYVDMDYTRNNTTFALTPVTGIPSFTVGIGSGVVRLRISLTDNTPGYATLGMIVDDISLQWTAPPVIVATDTVCAFQNNTFSIDHLPASGINYNWDFGTGATPATSTAATPTASWSSTGLKSVSCELSNGSCNPVTVYFNVFVRPVNTTRRDYIICPGQSVILSGGNISATWNVVAGGAPLSSLSCTSCQNPVAAPSSATTYYAYAANPNGCSSVDTSYVHIDADNHTLITPASPITICRPDSVHLQANTSGPAPLQNLPCGPVASPPGTTFSSQQIVPYQSAINLSPGSMSTPFPGTFTSAHRQYLLKAADLQKSGMYSGTLSSLAFYFLSNSTSSTMKNVTISVACTPMNALNPVTGFIAIPQVVYNAASVVIPAAEGYFSFPFATLYNWDTTQNLVIDICYNNDAASTDRFAAYANTSYLSCLYAQTSTGSACAGATAQALNQVPVIQLEYYQAPDAAWSYTWSPGSFTPSANVSSPSTYISANRKIYVTTRNRNGCMLKDSVSVVIPPKGSIIDADTSICLGSTVQLQAMNGVSYDWYEDNFQSPATLSCAHCPDPVATPNSTTQYAVVITGPEGCADTFYVHVKVTPFPSLYVLPRDTTIKYNQSVRLFAGGAGSYTWTPVNTLDYSNGPSPVASPQQTTQYIVTGYAAENSHCTSKDTVTVRIDYKNPFLIPTAFTPNGDGVNDLFRIVNLTFQKVVEFRIFNRWGQEVFNAQDNHGWDGTWNGVSQDIGVYHYYISIHIPDGTQENYKGDVTLVR